MTEKKKLGRPTTYTRETGETICKMLADGITLQDICKLPDMPDRHTIHDWMEKDLDFAAAYAHARKLQADTFAEMVLSEAFNSHDAQKIGRAHV